MDEKKLVQVSIWISNDKKINNNSIRKPIKSQTCRPEKQHGHGVYENPKCMFGLILLAAVDTSVRKSRTERTLLIDCVVSHRISLSLICVLSLLGYC